MSLSGIPYIYPTIVIITILFSLLFMIITLILLLGDKSPVSKTYEEVGKRDKDTTANNSDPNTTLTPISETKGDDRASLYANFKIAKRRM